MEKVYTLIVGHRNFLALIPFALFSRITSTLTPALGPLLPLGFAPELRHLFFSQGTTQWKNMLIAFPIVGPMSVSGP